MDKFKSKLKNIKQKVINVKKNMTRKTNDEEFYNINEQSKDKLSKSKNYAADKFDNLKSYYIMKKEKILNNAYDYKIALTDKYKEINKIREQKKNIKLILKRIIFLSFFSFNLYFCYNKLILNRKTKLGYISVFVLTGLFALFLNYFGQQTINKYYKQRMRENLI